jgi:hypothetical protein
MLSLLRRQLAPRTGYRHPHPPLAGYGGVEHGPPGEGDAAPYTMPLRGPAPLPGREKSGVGGTGIMTGETGPCIILVLL